MDHTSEPQHTPFTPNDFWNERYDEPFFIYGSAPNVFLKSTIDTLAPGKALFPAEGEGRNAVYAASLGWKVDALDFSEQARTKALEYAATQKVKINYQLADIYNFTSEATYDLIAFIFVPFPPKNRKELYQQYISLLNPGGRIILEFFNKKQLGNPSGGPKDIDWLLSKEELEDIFLPLDIVYLEELTYQLDEGPYHQGKADTVRMIAVNH